MHKTRRFFFIFLLSIIATTTFARQVSVISGSINTSDGKPAQFISVGLKNKGIGSVTNENGFYELLKVKPGNYVLRVSGVGIQNIEKPITVLAGQNQTRTMNPQDLRTFTGSVTYKF